MISQAFVVGAWDGTHLWLQWQETIPGDFEVQFALRKPGLEDWEDWLTPVEVRQIFYVFTPQRASGTEARARVRKRGANDWTDAKEATFAKSRCTFEFASQYTKLHYVEGTEFHRVVDGAVCSYVLTEEIEVPVGGTVQAEMESVAATGWSQLDRPNDFIIRPSYGVVIRNTEPSTNDLTATGRDYTALSVRRIGAFTFAMKDTNVVQ